MNGDKLTLRPEATAGIVRAMIEHNAPYNAAAGGSGPNVTLFRHERPAEGRYREFHPDRRRGPACLGPDVDAEQILMLAPLRDLGIPESRRPPGDQQPGPADERLAHRAALIAHSRPTRRSST